MNVKWLLFAGGAKYQATGAVFVIGVIFDYFANCNGIANFLNGDFTQNQLVNSVLGELKAILDKLLANFLNEHGMCSPNFTDDYGML
jgi:hypothetical protein